MSLAILTLLRFTNLTNLTYLCLTSVTFRPNRCKYFRGFFSQAMMMMMMMKRRNSLAYQVLQIKRRKTQN